MKKLLAVLFASLFITAPVFAEENIVYIREEDEQIVYEASDGLNDRFMHYSDMVPGKEYTDYLTIENGTENGYYLYFNITADNDSDKARDMIEHITMRIYINDQLYYNGKQRGKKYLPNSVNLAGERPALLKYFESGESAQVKVVSMLDTDYGDTENRDTSKTTWHLYYSDELIEEPEEPVEIPEVPKTHDAMPLWLVALVSAAAILVALIMASVGRKEKALRNR